MNIRFVFSVMAALWCSAAAAVIPQPRSFSTREGAFAINSLTVVSPEDDSLQPLALYMLDYIGCKRASNICPDNNFIRLAIDGSLAEEAYALTVGRDGISIVGGGYGGVFNGIQTLFQLLPDEIYTRKCRMSIISVGCCRVDDAPQFDYRGLMLDITRTWIDKERVKRYIDLASYHKLNKLHIHLCDDEGWRIEIKSHPELVGKGAWRGGDSPVKSVYGKWDERYGGFYTQEEMREIIAYAAVRNIEIIPEIDLPGHSRTMAQIHPEILCDYKPDSRLTAGYEYRSAWCVMREENYRLLEDILGEICELFPSEYVHVGGDEVDMAQWKRCPHCSDYAAAHCDNDYHRLEDLFMARVSDIVMRHGKRPAVWNEASVSGHLDKNTRVYGWESVEACLKATARGYKTIVMPGKYFYLDMRQSKYEDGHRWAAIFDVEDCSSFDFGKCGFTESQMENVAGVEAAFWSELYVSHNPESADYLDYQLFPRLCAVAETGWGKDNGRADFLDRLWGRHRDRMAGMGVRFRLSPPTVTWSDGELTASAAEGEMLCWSRENESEWRPYSQPIRTDKPAEYIFRSVYRTGVSPETGCAEHYERIYPKFRITSTMPASEKFPLSNAESYSGVARTARTCHEGDSITFEFEQPLRCREIEFLTGYDYLQKYIFDTGYLETSTDGVHFERAAEIYGGRAKLTAPEPFRFARMVSTCNGNGTPFVTISSPVVKPLL